MVQFGISYSENHELQSLSQGNIMDDPSINIPFHPGTISYAGEYFRTELDDIILCTPTKIWICDTK